MNLNQQPLQLQHSLLYPKSRTNQHKWQIKSNSKILRVNKTSRKIRSSKKKRALANRFSIGGKNKERSLLAQKKNNCDSKYLESYYSYFINTILFGNIADPTKTPIIVQC